MADKSIRLVYPNLPTGTNFSAQTYQPQPDWGAGSNVDYPTLRRVFKTTSGDLQKRIKPVGGGSSYTMPSVSSENTWSITGEDTMWDWDGAGMKLSGTTNPMAMVMGHNNPTSSDSSQQSWQRGVTGVSMYHINAAGSGYYGHYIDDMTLLYRLGDYTGTEFYGVDLIYNGNLMSTARKNYDNHTPFKTSSPRRGGGDGGFYVCIDDSSSVYKQIIEDNYVFQGIYFRWGSYEGNSPVVQKLTLANTRLIYDTYSGLDKGSRICANRVDTFRNSWDRNRAMKLTM